MNSMPSKIEHDQDICAWSRHNAQLIRQGRSTELDLINIAEELESMGRSIRRELSSRLRVLLVHLLKWRYQPQRQGNSWRLTIRNQRTEIRELLEESPSLRVGLPEQLIKQYQEARDLAALETELAVSTFPDDCPFSLDETLSTSYWPD